MMKQIRRIWLLAGLAVALVLGIGAGPARAYFTDRSQANGGLPVSVTPGTDIEEEYGAREKQVVISNNGTAPVFVRARAYATKPLEISGEGWTADDQGEWWYYDQPVAAKVGDTPGTTSELLVKVTFPEDAAESDEYNVIVVYESTPVQYNADGTPNADWNFKLDSGTSNVTPDTPEGGE